MLSRMCFVLHFLLSGPAQSHISPYILGQMNEEVSRTGRIPANSSQDEKALRPLHLAAVSGKG